MLHTPRLQTQLCAGMRCCLILGVVAGGSLVWHSASAKDLRVSQSIQWRGVVEADHIIIDPGVSITATQNLVLRGQSIEIHGRIVAGPPIAALDGGLHAVDIEVVSAGDLVIDGTIVGGAGPSAAQSQAVLRQGASGSPILFAGAQDGQRGGDVVLRAGPSGTLRVTESGHVAGGAGGAGAPASVTATGIHPGMLAQCANAHGGHGGDGGSVILDARQLQCLGTIEISNGGDGGGAISRAADGADDDIEAGVWHAAAIGGYAVARGGDGGASGGIVGIPSAMDSSAVRVLMLEHVRLGRGGNGGRAEAYAGKSGNTTVDHSALPDQRFALPSRVAARYPIADEVVRLGSTLAVGGHGGPGAPTGGNGGDGGSALAGKAAEGVQRFSSGSDGGDATANGTSGGDGSCSFGVGSDGGNGGDANSVGAGNGGAGSCSAGAETNKGGRGGNCIATGGSGGNGPTCLFRNGGGGRGGDATANTASHGGNGGCCSDGGPGGSLTAIGGAGGGGDEAGVGGNGTTGNGGLAGVGGVCNCAPVGPGLQGGNGAAGGSTSAFGGRGGDGIDNNSGGNGGNATAANGGTGGDAGSGNPAGTPGNGGLVSATPGGGGANGGSGGTASHGTSGNGGALGLDFSCPPHFPAASPASLAGMIVLLLAGGWLGLKRRSGWSPDPRER